MDFKKLMRIGLIADIHGNSPAFKVVLSSLSGEVDQIIFMGDLCGYYPFVGECIAMWDKKRIIGIRGNHDQVLLDCLQNQSQPDDAYVKQYGSALTRVLKNISPESTSLLQSFPESRILTLSGVTLSVYHGAPWDQLNGRVYPDFNRWNWFLNTPGDIVLLGHAHYPLLKRYKDKLIINPGSVGQPRDIGGEACFAILDLASGRAEHRRISFDTRRLINDAREHDPALSYLVEVLTRQ